MPSSTVKYLVKACDALVRQQARDIPFCEICQGYGLPEVVHYVGRRDLRFRFLRENWIRGCRECHRLAHQAGGKLWLRAQWIRIRGLATVEWLERESRRAPGPLGEQFLREEIRRLKGERSCGLVGLEVMEVMR